KAGATTPTTGATSQTTGTTTKQTGAGTQTLGASGSHQDIAIDYTKLAQAILDLQHTQVHEERQTDPALLTAPKQSEPQTDTDHQTTGASGSQPETTAEIEEISSEDADKIATAYRKLQEANAILETPKHIS